MGGCFSSESEQFGPPTAKVISVHGDLREYNLPACVSQVLQSEIASSSSSSSSKQSLFLCNSDLLLYDDFIPELDSKAQLNPNQIYFVLPKSRLQHKLTASDMAALAVKASLALQNANKSINRRKKARISPVLLADHNPVHDDDYGFKTSDYQKPKPQVPAPIGFSRSGSVRRFQKYTSRRAKLAVRSFKLRLTTIYEGTVL